MDRRSLIAGMAIAAAERLSAFSAASGLGVQKSILISMLPRELSYLDRFKLAVDVGFNLMRSGRCKTTSRPPGSKMRR